VGVHYEAVGVIGNLVHSSQNIKRKVGQFRLLSVTLDFRLLSVMVHSSQNIKRRVRACVRVCVCVSGRERDSARERELIGSSRLGVRR
jgi:hypothetical protein